MHIFIVNRHCINFYFLGKAVSISKIRNAQKEYSVNWMSFLPFANLANIWELSSIYLLKPLFLPICGFAGDLICGLITCFSS